MIEIIIVVGVSLFGFVFIAKMFTNGSEPSQCPSETGSILPMMLLSFLFSTIFAIYLISQAYGQEFLWELLESAKNYFNTAFTR